MSEKLDESKPNCCEICGRHISWLKPFCNPGTSVVGNRSVELLRLNYRPADMNDPENQKIKIEAQAAWKGAEKKCGPFNMETAEDEITESSDRHFAWMSAKYGHDKAVTLFCGRWAMERLSWECRECYFPANKEKFC